MNERKTFRVNYRTDYSRGCIKVYDDNFFIKANLREINKLLRLAKVHCTSDQQKALPRRLRSRKAVKYRDTA